MSRRRRDPGPPFRRDADGRMVVALHEAEVELLSDVAGELRELLEGADRGEPVLRRLFPRAYLDPTEEDAEANWQAIAGADLLQSRLDALGSLVASLDRARVSGDVVELRLDEEQEAHWLGVLNDARLALGTRLGVTDDPDDREVPPDDPAYAAHQVYAWLTYLQGELVEVLLGGLPEQ